MSELIKLADWSGTARANIVFVHGLGGHPYDTWRRGKDDFWPLWLAEDVEGAQVFTLGYAAPPTNWLGTAMPLQDRVNNVRARLLAELGQGDGPIVFICHSLGGLIVKQLLLALQQQKDRSAEAKAFLERVRQVVFMATPHTGAWHGSLLDKLRFIAWPSPIARVLVANDPTLRHINVSYRGLADERRGCLEHRVFYETQATEIGGIVDEASSDPGLPGEPPIAIDANHVSIVKPQDRTALQYVVTRNFVAKSPKSEGEGASFRAYPLPEVKFEQPSYHAPKVLRIVIITGLAILIYLGARTLLGSDGGGSTVAECGSYAHSGWSWFSWVQISGNRDCRKDSVDAPKRTKP